MPVSIAVYLGSFDPLTLGHLDIIDRGSKIFSKLVVGIGVNSGKNLFFSIEERLELTQKICSSYANIEVKSFNDLAVDFAQREGASVMIRGLRTESDYVYEMQMAMTNHTLNNNIESIFIPTRQSLCHISSSLVKEVAQLGGKVDQMVPPLVGEKLLKKIV